MLHTSKIVEETIDAVALDSERSEGSKATAAGGRSSTLRYGSSDTAQELGRRQSLGFNPNSRQGRHRTSSHAQGRDTSKMSFQHFYGIDVAKAKLDVADSQS